mmetsp:Transcript_5935/g.18598  ORF Transcript_5935/g.18598 Transcript_5935/m.18598 type:complete len:343 (+) Transcript_5935:231-1259(+)
MSAQLDQTEEQQFKSFAEKSAARSAALKQKWENARKEKVVVEEETPEHFWDAFLPDVARLSDAAADARDEAAVLKLEIDIQGLREQIAKSASYLKPYDVKRATADAQRVADAIAEAKNRVAPKQKFGFKKGSFTFSKPAAAPPAPKAPKGPEVKATAPTEAAAPGVRGERGAVLVLADDVGPQATLEDLEDCVVFVPRSLQTLRLVKSARCHVFAQAVAGPMYVIHCADCHVRVMPRQLRIHDTTNTTFHVESASGPIIEACSDVRFAPYAATWNGAAPEANFKIKKDAWKDVKDFKWLKREKNPNWDVLEASTFLAEVPAAAAARAAELGLALEAAEEDEC